MFGLFGSTERDTQSVSSLELAASNVAYAGCVAENLSCDLVDDLVLLPKSSAFAHLYALILQVETVRDTLLAVETALVAALPPLKCGEVVA